MGLIDVGGLGGKEILEPLNIKTENLFKPNDFDKEIVDKVDPLLKFSVINKKFNLGKLLKNYGCEVTGQNMYCPFHNDALTGKPSAKYHEKGDNLYCFSESKSYTAYHALKVLYNQDMDKVFEKVWSTYTLDEKREMIDNFSSSGSLGDTSQMVSPIWEKYKPLLEKFESGEVNYTQLKSGMYKVYKMISDAESVQFRD